MPIKNKSQLRIILIIGDLDTAGGCFSHFVLGCPSNHAVHILIFPHHIPYHSEADMCSQN